MPTIRVQQYDNGIKLYFTIIKDSVIEPILGATVHFKFQLEDGSRVLNKICEITDAELGECLYTLTTKDTSVVGKYITEIQVDYSNGTILSMDNPLEIIITEEKIGREDIDNYVDVQGYEARIATIERYSKRALERERLKYEQMKQELEDEVLTLMEQLENLS